MDNRTNLTTAGTAVLLLAAAYGSITGCGGGGAGDPDAANDEVVQDAHIVKGAGCVNPGTEGATSPCLSPTRTPEYYVEQGLKYFDTLDVDADPYSVPVYSELVARWEWPPWLKLTGFGRDTMVATGDFLKQFDPSTVPTRDCRAFDVQPFCRCYVNFEYEGGPCPIYEEFTFNDAGEMTFIEAWSDLPGMLPMDKAADPWAKAPGVARLSTRVPGLGKEDGLVDIDGKWMKEVAATDQDVAQFALRAADQWSWWLKEMDAAGDDLFARGCGWQ